jgi:hypothetical protein
VISSSQGRYIHDRLNAGIVVSNPAQDMDVFAGLLSVCVVTCVDSGLATG